MKSRQFLVRYSSSSLLAPMMSLPDAMNCAASSSASIFCGSVGSRPLQMYLNLRHYSNSTRLSPSNSYFYSQFSFAISLCLSCSVIMAAGVDLALRVPTTITSSELLLLISFSRLAPASSIPFLQKQQSLSWRSLGLQNRFSSAIQIIILVIQYQGWYHILYMNFNLFEAACCWGLTALLESAIRGC